MHQIRARILTKGRAYPVGERCRLVLEMGSASCSCQIRPLIPTKWKAYLAGNRGLVTGKVNLADESATLALRKRRVSSALQCRYSVLGAESVVLVCRNNVWDPRQRDIFSEINFRSRRAGTVHTYRIHPQTPRKADLVSRSQSAQTRGRAVVVDQRHVFWGERQCWYQNPLLAPP